MCSGHANMDKQQKKRSSEKVAKKQTQITKPQKNRRHKKIKNVEGMLTEHGEFNRDYFRKGDYNRRPKGEGVQEVPSSFKEFMKSTAMVDRPKGRKRKREEPQVRGMTRPLKPVPQFKRKKGEKKKQFFQRMDLETREIINKHKIEEKFEVDLDDIGRVKDGQVSLHKKPLKDRKKERLKQKKQKKKEGKIQNRQERLPDFSALQDKVEFGEVAMAPPNLTAPPRKVQNPAERRPGTKSLLLTDLMQQNTGQSVSTLRQVGKTQKRKLMSLSQQRIMDSERERAVEMYRLAKEKKLQQQGT